MLARVAVAASGGRDSTALLHCATHIGATLGVEVVALHVHHGLHADADAWLTQVQRQARRWGAEFACQRLLGRPRRGDSIEAWARRERYRALAELAHASGCGIVLLAHHRRDQAETWLLQALRGGGAAALAAMPREAQRGGLTWARPWLDQPRQAIEAYVRRHRLGHADDPGNADLRHPRNRLRLQVWPALLRAFPDAETTLSSAAAQAQRAAVLASETVALDLPALLKGGALRTAPWLGLPPGRRRNALAAWLRLALHRGSPETLVERLLAELPTVAAGCWDAPGACLRLYRGLLRATPAAPAALPSSQSAAVAAPGARAADTILAPPLDLSAPGAFAAVPWHGHFVVAAVTRAGAAPALLRAVIARERRGGERFRLSPNATARSLKKQFQARGVPAWGRGGPLLVTPGGQLVFVPGLGIEGAAQAAPGEPQLGLTWVPAAAPQTGRRQTHR